MGTNPSGADLLGYTTGAMPALAVGKLPPQLLERLLGKVPLTDPRVVMGPRLGEDAAVLDLGEACAELGVALIGGHTEVTAGLPRAIVSGCMLGEVEKDRLVTTGGARPGDTLLLTKGVPLEGAAIVARERAAEAGRRGVAADVVKRAQ